MVNTGLIRPAISGGGVRGPGGGWLTDKCRFPKIPERFRFRNYTNLPR